MKKKDSTNSDGSNAAPAPKPKKKKESSKSRAWERERRVRLNNSFSELGRLLVVEEGGSPPIKKQEILQQACTLIASLKQENVELRAHSSDSAERPCPRELRELRSQVSELTRRMQQLAEMLEEAGGKLPSWLSLPASKQAPPRPLGRRRLLYSHRLRPTDLESIKSLEKPSSSQKTPPVSKKKKKPVKKSAVKKPVLPAAPESSGVLLLPPGLKKPSTPVSELPPGILVLKSSAGPPPPPPPSSGGLLIVRGPAPPPPCILLPPNSSAGNSQCAQTTTLLTAPIMATGQPTGQASNQTYLLTNGNLVSVVPQAQKTLAIKRKPTPNKNSNKVAIPKLPKKASKPPAKKPRVGPVCSSADLTPLTSILTTVCSGKEQGELRLSSGEVRGENSQEKGSKELSDSSAKEITKSDVQVSETNIASSESVPETSAEKKGPKETEPSGGEVGDKTVHKSSYSIDALCKGQQAGEQNPPEKKKPVGEEIKKKSVAVKPGEKSKSKANQKNGENKENTPSSEPSVGISCNTECSGYTEFDSLRQLTAAEISPSGFIGPQPPMATVVEDPHPPPLSKETIEEMEVIEQPVAESIPSSFSSELFASLSVPSGHPESISPTAAFLLAFPLVSTGRSEAERAEPSLLGAMEENQELLMEHGDAYTKPNKSSTYIKQLDKQYLMPFAVADSHISDCDPEISSIMSQMDKPQRVGPQCRTKSSEKCRSGPKYTSSEKQFTSLRSSCDSNSDTPIGRACKQKPYATQTRSAPVSYSQPVCTTSTVVTAAHKTPAEISGGRSLVDLQPPSIPVSYFQPICSTTSIAPSGHKTSEVTDPQVRSTSIGYTQSICTTSRAQTSNLQKPSSEISDSHSRNPIVSYSQPVCATSAAPTSNLQKTPSGDPRSTSISYSQSICSTSKAPTLHKTPAEVGDTSHFIGKLNTQNKVDAQFKTPEGRAVKDAPQLPVSSQSYYEFASSGYIPSLPPASEVLSHSSASILSWSSVNYDCSKQAAPYQPQETYSSELGTKPYQASYPKEGPPISYPPREYLKETPQYHKDTPVSYASQLDSAKHMQIHYSKENMHTSQFSYFPQKEPPPISYPPQNFATNKNTQAQISYPHHKESQGPYVSKDAQPQISYPQKEVAISFPPQKEIPQNQYPSEKAPQISYPPPKPPQISYPPQKDAQLLYVSHKEYPPEKQTHLTYPAPKDSQATYAVQKDTQIPYAPQKEIQTPYSQKDSTQTQYLAEKQALISYPPPKDTQPQILYPPQKGAQISYMPQKDLQLSYTPQKETSHNPFSEKQAHISYPPTSKEVSYPPHKDLYTAQKDATYQLDKNYPPKETPAPTPRPPVNWMTTPDVRQQQQQQQQQQHEFIAPCSQPSSFTPNYTEFSEHAWQGFKGSSSHPLPTLLGDLALGPTTPSSPKTSYKPAQRKDKHVNTFESTKGKSAADFGGGNFLSVSQLVEHKAKKQRSATKSARGGRERNKNSSQFSQQQLNEVSPLCNWPAPKPSYSSYSAEALIGLHAEQNPRTSMISGDYTYFSESIDYQPQQSYAQNSGYNAAGFGSDTGGFSTEFLFPPSSSTSTPARAAIFPGPDVSAAVTGTKAAESSKSRGSGAPKKVQGDSGYEPYIQDFPGARQGSAARCGELPSFSQTRAQQAGASLGAPGPSLTNFNLSTIFPEINDKTPSLAVSSKALGSGGGGASGTGDLVPLHHPNFLTPHNPQVGIGLNQSFPPPNFSNIVPPSLPFPTHEH